MASNITPKLNLSIAPRKINNQPLSIFNPDTDFKTDSDVTYVNAEGDTMKGELTVPSLVTNGGITLQSVYPSLPTQSQLGGVYKSVTTTETTNAMRNFLANYGNLSLPAGCYTVFYSFVLLNNLGTSPRPLITYNNIQGGLGITTTETMIDTKHYQIYSQSMFDNGTITMQGSTFYQHNNATNRLLYMLCYVSGNIANANCSVIATITAVRVG